MSTRSAPSSDAGAGRETNLKAIMEVKGTIGPIMSLIFIFQHKNQATIQKSIELVEDKVGIN